MPKPGVTPPRLRHPGNVLAQPLRRSGHANDGATDGRGAREQAPGDARGITDDCRRARRGDGGKWVRPPGQRDTTARAACGKLMDIADARVGFDVRATCFRDAALHANEGALIADGMLRSAGLDHELGPRRAPRYGCDVNGVGSNCPCMYRIGRRPDLSLPLHPQKPFMCHALQPVSLPKVAARVRVADFRRKHAACSDPCRLLVDAGAGDSSARADRAIARQAGGKPRSRCREDDRGRSTAWAERTAMKLFCLLPGQQQPTARKESCAPRFAAAAGPRQWSTACRRTWHSAASFRCRTRRLQPHCADGAR